MTDETQPPDDSVRVVGPIGADGQPFHIIVDKEPTTGLRARIPFLKAFQFGAVLTALGFGLSALGLWFQSVYVPSTLPAVLSVSVEMAEHKVGPSAQGVGDLEEFEALIHVKNSGNRRVTVLAGQYQVWGFKLVRREQDEFDAAMAQEQGLCWSPIGGRYLKQGPEAAIPLAAGRILDQSWFDAGQEADVRIPLFVRPGESDIAELTVDVWMAKGDMVQTDTRPTKWTADELAGDVHSACGFDVEGDLTADPLYWSYYRYENRAPILGSLFPDTRRIAVEWRPATVVGRRQTSGAECDPNVADANAAYDRCVTSIRYGGTGPGTFVEPTIAYCPTLESADPCDLTATMPLQRLFDLERDLGMAVSSARTDLVLWPDADQPAADQP